MLSLVDGMVLFSIPEQFNFAVGMIPKKSLLVFLFQGLVENPQSILGQALVLLICSESWIATSGLAGANYLPFSDP